MRVLAARLPATGRPLQQRAQPAQPWLSQARWLECRPLHAPPLLPERSQRRLPMRGAPGDLKGGGAGRGASVTNKPLAAVTAVTAVTHCGRYYTCLSARRERSP